MIINIEKITSYRDGGTISIIGFIQGFKEREICIDKRIGSECNSVWIGYPDKKNSIRITDIEFLETLKKSINDYVESVKNYQQQILELI